MLPTSSTKADDGPRLMAGTLSEAPVRNLETMEDKILKINYPQLHTTYIKCRRIKTKEGGSRGRERRKGGRGRRVALTVIFLT